MDHLSIPSTREHREIVADFAATHAKEISHMLLNVPRPLLLLLKTNGECSRSRGGCVCGEDLTHADSRPRWGCWGQGGWRRNCIHSHHTV